MAKTCSRCALPCQGISSLCRVHRNERTRQQRSVSCRTARPTTPDVPDQGQTDWTPQPKRVLFIPDCHHPYVDKSAWALMLRAATEFRPDILVVLGDFGDFYSVSAHDKNPTRTNDLEYEVGKIREARAQLDALGASRKIFVEGNHEFRLARYLASNAPALYKMMNVAELFQLKENGWEYTPYKASVRIGKLHLTHDTGTAGQNAHRQSMNAFQGSVIIGHTHRMEFSVLGNADGPPQVGAMFGWLGDFNDIDYMHAISAKRAWVHGFGVGILEPDGVIHLSPVPIVNSRCCVFGVVVR